MKTLISSLFVIMFAISMYSQNIIDPPKLPHNFNNSSIYDRNFDKTNFLIGWNWGSRGLRLDEALNINYYHDGYDTKYDTNNPNPYLSNENIANHRKVTQLAYVTGGRQHNVVLNSHSMLFFPTITVDSTENFIPREYDSSGAVFGWYTKNSGINGTSGTNDFDRFILNRTSVTSPTLVLSNIWKNKY